MQSLLLIIVVFFLMLLIIPILIKAHFSYDILNNLGTISLHIFFIKIICYKFKLKNKNIILLSNKNKKEVETELSNNQVRYLEQFTVQIKEKIIIRKVHIFSRIGTGDASNTAILTGLFNVVSLSFLAKIKNTKKSAVIGVFSQPSYNEKHFIISIYGSIMITIFDIIYSYIMSLAIIKRSEKYERV